MQKFNFETQYVKGKENFLTDFLLRRPFLNAMSLMNDIMLNNIKGFYRDDTFFSIHFESLSKEFRTLEKLINYLLVFWMRIFYIISMKFVFLRWGIIKRTLFMIVTIFQSQVIQGFRKYMW